MLRGPPLRVQVYIGRDTRQSSESLAGIFRAAVQAGGGKVVDMGIVTTPQVRAGACYRDIADGHAAT